MTEEFDLVCVQKCYGLDVAEIYKGKLEAMDIPVMLQYDSAAKLFGLTIDGLGEVRIMVPSTHAAEAKMLLAGTDQEEEDSDQVPLSSPPSSP
jgi:hypothetical protein